MQIIAHRGMSIEYPENTMPALKAACQKGFGIELDAHRTKDGFIVVIHDSEIQRVTNGDGLVTEKALSELRKLDNGSWFHSKFRDIKIPTLAETCEVFKKEANKNAEMAINIKDDREKDIEKLVADCIIRYKIQKRCFVFDMGLESIKRFRSFYKQIRTAARVNEKEPLQRLKSLDDVDIIWLDEFFGNFYNEGVIKKIHDCNKKVYAVSPELHKREGHPRALAGYDKTWESLISWGIDGICTDYPSQLFALLSNKKLKKD